MQNSNIKQKVYSSFIYFHCVQTLYWSDWDKCFKTFFVEKYTQDNSFYDGYFFKELEKVEVLKVLQKQ